MNIRVIHVAVGVIVDEDGNILIAKRPDKTHQGGLWEFPGGKVEPAESLFDALKRELHEELAINITAAEPLIKIRHDYGDKIVLLDVHKVTGFEGEPVGNEGQPILWVAPKDLCNYDFPVANRPIITAVNLPRRLLITGEAESHNEYLYRTERALAAGIRLIQLRVANPETSDFSKLIQTIAKECSKYSAALQINTSVNYFLSLPSLPEHIGLHLNSKNLLTLKKRPLEKNILLSASCHNEMEINYAQKIGVDFICLSHVLLTKSHPNAEAIGWEKFTQLIEVATIPVFALGGMSEKELPVATASGAQGIASISAWWDL